MMEYISTRGRTASMPFLDAVMTGQAPDGGLLVPSAIPQVQGQLAQWRELGYADLAYEILALFADDIPPATLRELVQRSYATFDTPDVTPVKKVGDLFVMELFHGPTLAFKDIALQLLGNLFEYILGRTGAQLNILGATSGDTGSAGIYGVRGKNGIRIFVMYPDGKTSPVQERQMTTVLDENVHCLAMRGSFDDCQGLMKNIFNDLEFKDRYHLGAINSVNCARLVAQIVYYFYGYFRVVETLGDPICFSVPTGNFGDIFAGYLAKEMGLPIDKLILATNENDILRVFFDTGVYRRGGVHATLSPSMDIQVASNFERYLFYRLDKDTEVLTRFMEDFATTGEASLGNYIDLPALAGVSPLFCAKSAHREKTLAVIERYYADHGYLFDPHTAVGVAAAEEWLGSGASTTPVVCLATAHPAKFPEAIEAAVGSSVATHPSVEELGGRPSNSHRLDVDIAQVRDFIARACG